MNKHELAREAQWLRDQKAFQNVIAAIEGDLSKALLDARTSDEGVAEARQTVAGLAAIQRKIRALIDAPKIADSKKGQHRASD